MANAGAYLPPPFPESLIRSLLSTLSLPPVGEIKPLTTSGDYHTIYRLSYPPDAFPFLANLSETTDPSSLVLRISGHHYPGTKTQNEVSVLNFINQETSIPAPYIIRSDNTTANVLGHEFMILTCIKGVSFDKVKGLLINERKEEQYDEILEIFLNQVVDIIGELDKPRWTQIGGLKEVLPPEVHDSDQHALQVKSTFVPGPLVDETMWQYPELAIFWSHDSSITLNDLNASGPFHGYTSFLAAQAEKYIYAIKAHPSLLPLRASLPLIQDFISEIQQPHNSQSLNATRLVLAHRDLHFGNIMFDLSTRRITGVLDWEFSAVVPSQRWDPSKALMWDCTPGEESRQEKMVLQKRLEDKCKDSGVMIFEDARWRNEKQETMHLAMTSLRVICEVLPRGQEDKPWQSRKAEMERCMRSVIGTESFTDS